MQGHGKVLICGLRFRSGGRCARRVCGRRAGPGRDDGSGARAGLDRVRRRLGPRCHLPGGQVPGHHDGGHPSRRHSGCWTVNFSDGGTLLATVPLDGSGTATFATSNLVLGSHAITATYSGDANFLGAPSTPAAESVTQARTAIVLVPHPVFRKKHLKSVGLTAEIEPVSPGGGIPNGGVVTFEYLKKHRKKVKVKTVGTAAVINGDATLTVKPNKVLKKPLTIVYSGDTDYVASTVTPPKLTKKALKNLA